MRLARLLAAAFVSLAATAATAADLSPIMSSAPTPLSAPASGPGFDWGAYVGTYGTTEIPLPSPFGAIAGVIVGYDFARNHFLAGVSLVAHVGLGTFDRRDVQINGRLGFLISDRILAYTRFGVGVGTHFVPISRVYLYAAGGLEFGLGERVSMFSEIGYPFGFDFANQLYRGPLVATIGINWHPGH